MQNRPPASTCVKTWSVGCGAWPRPASPLPRGARRGSWPSRRTSLRRPVEGQSSTSQAGRSSVAKLSFCTRLCSIARIARSPCAGSARKMPPLYRYPMMPSQVAHCASRSEWSARVAGWREWENRSTLKLPSVSMYLATRNPDAWAAWREVPHSLLGHRKGSAATVLVHRLP